jgi:hypothetical protein
MEKELDLKTSQNKDENTNKQVSHLNIINCGNLYACREPVLKQGKVHQM